MIHPQKVISPWYTSEVYHEGGITCCGWIIMVHFRWLVGVRAPTSSCKSMRSIVLSFSSFSSGPSALREGEAVQLSGIAFLVVAAGECVLLDSK